MRKFVRVFIGVWGFSALCISWSWAQGADPRLFKPSTMISVEASKKELKRIYLDGGSPKTLHCGCFFDKLKQVYPKNCEDLSLPVAGRGPRKKLGWTHGMPIAKLAGTMRCWREPVCSRPGGERVKGAKCCEEISPKFKSMEADMHNLYPVIEEAVESGKASGNPVFGGLGEYKYCKKEIMEEGKPRPSVRGDLARVYFYMSYQYKVRIPEELEEALRTWHLQDPPDDWEERRNTLIEEVQGNRNPFIDHPELAERVRDF